MTGERPPDSSLQEEGGEGGNSACKGLSPSRGCPSWVRACSPRQDKGGFEDMGLLWCRL